MPGIAGDRALTQLGRELAGTSKKWPAGEARFKQNEGNENEREAKAARDEDRREREEGIEDASTSVPWIPQRSKLPPSGNISGHGRVPENALVKEGHMD